MSHPDVKFDAFCRGISYLRQIRRFALSPSMIDVIDDLGIANSYQHQEICTWIGENIQEVNATLTDYLDACHQCFALRDRPVIQIFATPLAEQFGIDGLCNIFVNPITILIDVGRTSPSNWLGIVAHEYTHACVGDVGHGERFAKILTHLCLGLGLDLPVWEAETMEAWLSNYPHCQSKIDPLAFWSGQPYIHRFRGL